MASSGGRDHRASAAVRGRLASRVSWGALAFLLVVGSAWAFDSLTPRGSSPIGPSGGGYMGQGNWFANGEHIPGGYYKKNYTVPWAKLGAAARAGLRGVVRFSPIVAFAMSAAEQSGWVIEGDTVHLGDGAPQAPLAAPGWWWCLKTPYTTYFGGVGMYCALDMQSICDHYLGLTESNYGKVVVECRRHATNPQIVQLVLSDNYGTYNGTLANYSTYPAGVTNINPSSPDTPVSDGELAQKIAQVGGPAAGRALLNDNAGAPHRYQEYVDAENALRQELEAGHGTTITPIGLPVVDPETGTGLDPTAPPTPTPDELPLFCEWASKVCEFIDWMQAEAVLETPPVPEEQVPIETQEWSSGLADDGTCPAPFLAEFDFLGRPAAVEFSVQPICDFAVFIRSIVIAMGLLVAGYIVAGVRAE